jgi:hypothetical protein
MGVYTIIMMERTNLPKLFPRVCLTGTGDWIGSAPAYQAIGGTVQFGWDQQFYWQVMSLLDPAAARADLLAWVGRPIQSDFALELDNMQPTGYFYAYTAIALYRGFSSYARITNDTAFLTQTVGYMEELATFWMRYAKGNSTLADYSASADAYLECVPTYTHVVAGLQASDAYMALDLAELRAAQGNATGAAYWKGLAQRIAEESIPLMYVANTTIGPTPSGAASGGGDGGGDASASASASLAPGDYGGWWRCIDTGHSNNGTEVRHVIDYGYAASGFCALGRGQPAWPCYLDASQRAQMVDFALSQLVLPTKQWLRALSPRDALHYIQRPDHGTTGADHRLYLGNGGQ